MSDENEVEAEAVSDLNEILPEATPVMVAGVKCTVRRLKTREFLSLMRVLTAGFGPALVDVKFDLDDPDQTQGDLVALMLLALPNAADEFVMFLRTVVEPVNDEDSARVAAYLMDNPDVDVLMDIFEIVATQEKDDLSVLAGKVQAMVSRLGDLYRPKKKTPIKRKSSSRG